MNLQSLVRLSMLWIILAAFSITAQAQAYTVSGWVLDENDEPVIGASVAASKTEVVLTDVNGEFKIRTNPGTILTVRYVGYKEAQQKAANGMKFKLVPTSEQLEQLVVVGYGTQKKVNLTGAVQSINSDEIIKRSVSNGSNVLQGIVPGLTAVQGSGAPGGDGSSLTVRGVGSINSDTSPLVLIDGVEGDMNRIDLNTVESISVLKDAASASIYGARAANGVILITTKRGAQGKTKVTFNGYMGWNKPTGMPHSVDAVTYLRAMDQARINNDQEPIYAETIEKYLTEGPDNMTLFDTDWRDLIIKKSAMLQNYSVSVSGGSETAKVFASGGYYKQDGMVNNNEFSRMNLRLNSDLKVNQWLDLGVDMSVRQAEALNPIGGATTHIGYALTFVPTWSAINADGTWGYGNRGGNNPYAAINAGGYSKSVAPEYKAKLSASIHPFKGLDIVGFYTWQRNDATTKTFASTYEEFEGGVSVGVYPMANKAARESRSSGTLKQYNVIATYENTFAEKHYLKLMAGYQSEEFKSSSLEGYRSNFPYDGYEDVAHGDATTATNSTYRYEWAMMSAIFRVNYIFNNRYLLEVNGRYDGTSRFLRNKRWGFFPSVSAGWRISEENFWENLRPLVNNLKLRASLGKLGNQNLSGTYYPYLAAVSGAESFSYPFDKILSGGAAQTQLSNPNITWEKSSQWDIGLDWGLFNNRLSGGFDFYYRKIEDMLQQFQVPNFVGMTSPWVNGGTMRNQGWEISLDWHDRIGDVNYYVKGNLSDVRNKVIDLLGNEYKSDTRYTKVGSPLSSWYAYVADGLFTSYDEINAKDADGNYLYAVYGERDLIKPGYIKYVDLNKDGKIDGDDRQIMNDARPHFEYGISLGLDWKGIDFSALIQGVGQKDVYYTGAGAKPFIGNGTIYAYQLDTWSEENPNGKFPLLLNDPQGSHINNYFSSFWLQSGAYCRLKNITIGYTLPRKWTQQAFIERVRIYASAQNLLTIKGNNFYEGFDPEQSYGSSVSCYPLNKTFLFGLNIDF